MGKKYIEDFVFNTITLEQILHKIKVDLDESYYYELLKDLDVHRIVDQVSNRYSFRAQGFLISKDVVRGLVESELLLLTWREFKLWKVAQDNIKKSYLAFIYKYLPLRVYREMQKERPNYKPPKQIVDEYFDEKDKNETGEYKESDYQYCEILSGGINDLEILSDEMQESRWNSTFGQDFQRMDEDDKFEELIEGLTENQQDILRKTYKDKYTEREISEDKGICHQSVHEAKHRALNNLRKKLENKEINK